MYITLFEFRDQKQVLLARMIIIIFQKIAVFFKKKKNQFSSISIQKHSTPQLDALFIELDT